MKYNIVFSIPIHEKFEVVIDQVLNFFHFNPNCAIVFHISQGFNYKESGIDKNTFLSIIDHIGNVYINPESVRTGRDDIIQAHLSNFIFICKYVDFDFFSMCASNELFVKEGLYERIKSCDCGVSFIDINKRKYNDWTPGIKARKDTALINYLRKNSVNKIMGSHIEGSFYRKKLFEEIVSEILSFYDYLSMPFSYPRDEVYFSSILWMIICNRHPVTLCKEGIFCYVRWNGNVDYKIWIWDIDRLQKGNKFYSVKRVDREFNANFRVYARRKFEYDKAEKEYGLINCNVESISNIKRKELIDYCISHMRAIKIAIPYYLSRLFGR